MLSRERPARSPPFSAVAIAGLCFSLLLGLAAGASAAPARDRPRLGRGAKTAARFAGVQDPARAFFARLRGASPLRLTAPRARASSASSTRCTASSTRCRSAAAASLAVTETFTLRSWLRPQHRAVIFLCGSVFRGNHFSIPVAGYDGSAMVAQRAGFAFTVDYLGVGGSTLPADGRTATYEAQREAARILVSYIRFFRLVPKVDLVGDGFGGAMAAELAADGARVRSAAMSAMIYREVNGGPLSDPAFIALLEVLARRLFLRARRQLADLHDRRAAGRARLRDRHPGRQLPDRQFLAAADRPFFDPSQAQAPGLVFYGPNDFIAVAADVADLAAEYGASGATLAVNPGAGHAPRTEGPAIAAWYGRPCSTSSISDASPRCAVGLSGRRAPQISTTAWPRSARHFLCGRPRPA